MARFDVYRTREFDDLVLDCQADTLNDLPTRFVVPLIPAALIARAYARLNPVFRIAEAEYMMGTQMAAAVPVANLGVCVTTLAPEQSAVMNALDMLLTGY